jgi:hypothetical protein
MIETISTMKKQYHQSLAGHLDRRLSSVLSDDSLLQALPELKTPMSMHAINL